MSNWFFDVIIWCSEFASQVFIVQEAFPGTCHSEGATRRGLMAEKKIFSGAQLETMATEESPVASRSGQILRRPDNEC